MPIRTILVALTLGDDSARTARRAVQLAARHGAQLIGVHVIEDSPLRDFGLPVALDAAALAAIVEEDAVGRLRSLLADAETPVVHVEPGRPHDVIVGQAISRQADLIVIGPGVAGNLREKVFGSTADRVVRCAPCPVLVVRSEADAPYRRIVVGADLSEHAKAAALSASRLSPDASRELLHAIEIPLAFEQAMLQAGTSQADLDRYRETMATTARRRIVETFGVDGRLPKETRVRIVHADAATALLNASRRRTTDLVAVGTQGSNAVAQRLLGSVARKVLSHANCDVLAVPELHGRRAPGRMTA